METARNPAKAWSFGYCCSSVLFLLVSGCGGGASLEARLKDMEQELNRQQNRVDVLEERMAAMDLSGAAPESNSEAQKASVSEKPPLRFERPRLKVIHLEPGDAEPVEPVADAATPTMPLDRAQPKPRDSNGPEASAPHKAEASSTAATKNPQIRLVGSEPPERAKGRPGSAMLGERSVDP